MLFSSTNICLWEDKQAYIWLHPSRVFKLLSVVVLHEGSSWVMLRRYSYRTQHLPTSLALRDCWAAKHRPPLSPAMYWGQIAELWA